jgi:allantoinase
METDAIRAALEICGETGCALHVVHVSSSEGVELITDAKKRGANVSCEICAHYLLFTGGDMERLGAVAKCAPPMRDQSNLARLWKCVRSGHVDTVGSDHSPSPWELKAHGDFFKAWGGISGVQHLLPALLDAGLEPSQLALLASQNPARRFSLPQKGKLEVGADADLALVEFGESLPVSAADLFYRHKHSPYIGRCLRARVRRTILRGKTVFDDGKITSTGGGRLVKPL